MRLGEYFYYPVFADINNNSSRRFGGGGENKLLDKKKLSQVLALLPPSYGTSSYAEKRRLFLHLQCIFHDRFP